MKKMTSARGGQLCLVRVICICTVVVLVSLVSIASCQNEEFHTTTPDCNSHRRQRQQQPQPQQVRQQRKYVPIGQAAKLQQQQQHEEFSLITSALAQNAANLNLNNLLADTNHSAESQADSAAAGSGATTPTMVGLDSIGSSVVLQPPVTTTSSIMSSANKSPQPPAPAPATTTTASATSLAAEPNSSPSPPTTTSTSPTTTVATTSPSSTDLPKQHEPTSGHSSTKQHGEATQRSLSLDSHQSQPISSSPSSVSIITPLINPAAAQQQQHTTHVSASIGGGGGGQSSSESQQSMMRPIYVVGNPITERDYYSAPANSNSNSRYPSEQHGEQSSVSSPSPVPPAAEPTQVEPQVEQAKQEQPTTSRQANKSSRMDDSINPQPAQVDVTLQSQQDPPTGERMSGPPLVYSGGFLGSAVGNQTAPPVAASPRLFQQNSTQQTVASGASVVPQLPRRPSLPPPVNQANAASGFRSPLSPSGPLLANGNTQQQQQPLAPISSVPVNSMSNFYQSSPPYAGNSLMGNSFPTAPQQQQPQPQPLPQQQQPSPPMLAYNKQAYALANQAREQQQAVVATQQAIQQQQQVIPSPMPGTAPGSGRRPLNITRVEHISAECSNDLIRAVIVFNGTFKGIIYSSGYVNDPTCLYVNGTGSTRYEFNIRLNQCGTLGRQELHQPTIPGEARRRDQVMWNTLSIQYNSIIEQEWDEHFRVSCEYGSDFWKTVSFNPFNVETNTGSPVVFTINPPQCQMDVLLGHGMGPKIAVDGPVTVGDPLTLLIHMKSEKAGYDILVKNCVAHNGGKQRMQLIDSNGCVVNERFISPFRGTYNDNDLRHVTLYAYLKAFRFTGSPVLYLECEIHMCQSACPPQMCYWRRLSKRSVDESDYEYVASNSSALNSLGNEQQQHPVISDSLSLFKALQVRQEPDEERAARRNPLSARQSKRVRDIFAEDEQASLVCYRHAEVYLFLMTIGSLLLLLVSVAVTCCLRLRNLAKSSSSLFKHGRLLGSPSLLSLGSGNDASSIISASTASHLHSPVVASATADSNFQEHLAFMKPPAKRPPGAWPNMAHADLAAARKQRHQQQQYLASFAQFSPKPAHR